VACALVTEKSSGRLADAAAAFSALDIKAGGRPEGGEGRPAGPLRDKSHERRSLRTPNRVSPRLFLSLRGGNFLSRVSSSLPDEDGLGGDHQADGLSDGERFEFSNHEAWTLYDALLERTKRRGATSAAPKLRPCSRLI
jgi:hypothetical protein